MTDVPLPLYQCQHTEIHRLNWRGRKHKHVISRCTLVATHLIGLDGKCAVRLCEGHAKEVMGRKFEEAAP